MVERPLPVDPARCAERFGDGPVLDRVLLQPERRLRHRVPTDVRGRRQPTALPARRLPRSGAGVLQRELLPPQGFRGRRAQGRRLTRPTRPRP